jgi:tetratricopeptide (TPR) repeat protein
MKRRRLVICVLLLPLLGCTEDPAKQAFFRYDYTGAVELYRPRAERFDKNFVLNNLNLGASALLAGDYADARIGFDRATQIMYGYTGELRGNLSLVAAEDVKFFKGEPFEKAMASIYYGILCYNRGEPDNARASFSQALLADTASQEGFREDFALAHFLQARAMLKMGGEDDNVRIALEKARKVYPQNPYFNFDVVRHSNLIVIVELGTAPIKTRTGLHGEYDTFVRCSYPEQGATVSLDGKLLGTVAKTVDLFQQAETRGSSGKDVAQGLKGGVKTGLLAAAWEQHNENRDSSALLLALIALLIPAGADVRQWDLLPGEVHVFATTVPPGQHTLTLGFLGANGQPLPRYQQTWQGIVVSDTDDKLLLFRSGPDKPSGGVTNPGT